MSPIALAIYFTDTRGVWVGFGVTLALMAFTRSRMRKFGLYIVALAAIVYLSGAFSKFSLWEESLFSKRSETVDYRWANYATTYTMFKRNPLFGIGYGNFNRMWRQYFSTTDDSAEIRDLADGNNTTFLAILGEEGLLGFSAYFAIFLCAIKVCRDAFSRLKGENWELERRFVVVAAGSLSAFLFMGITTDVRFHSFFNVSLFLLLGISSSLNASNAQGNESSPSSSENESPRVMLRPLASTRP
jgi:O-antigen ligase